MTCETIYLSIRWTRSRHQVSTDICLQYPLYRDVKPKDDGFHGLQWCVWPTCARLNYKWPKQITSWVQQTILWSDAPRWVRHACACHPWTWKGETCGGETNGNVGWCCHVCVHVMEEQMWSKCKTKDAAVEKYISNGNENNQFRSARGKRIRSRVIDIPSFIFFSMINIRARKNVNNHSYNSGVASRRILGRHCWQNSGT